MSDIYIGLGSNLDDPEKQIQLARQAITEQNKVTEISFSSLYSSPPMGPQDQPNYVNAVMCITTNIQPIELLKILQKIEDDFGRVRTERRWRARVVDLDILLYGDQQINLPELIVPHIGLPERAFVLYPLAEIASENLNVPGKGTLKQLVANCPLNNLEKIS